MSLFEAIRQNIHLEIIEIRSSYQQNLPNPLFKSLDENSFKFKNLKNLSLGFDKRDNGGNSCLMPISKLFDPIPGLLQLTLDFCCCSEIGDFAVSDLSEGLKNLKSLISLNLNFNYCQHVSNEGLKKISEALLSMPILESFRIDLTGVTIDDEGIMDFCSVVQKLRSLRLFKLDMDWMGLITDIVLEALYETVVNLKYLSTVQFDFLIESDEGKVKAIEIFKYNLKKNTKINEVSVEWHEEL